MGKHKGYSVTRINKIFKRIWDWNKKFGNYYGMLTPKVIHPRDKIDAMDMWKEELAMLKEEIEETTAAMSERDQVEMLDGCLDVAYVAIGTIMKVGDNFKNNISVEQIATLASMNGVYDRVGTIEDTFKDIEYVMSSRQYGHIIWLALNMADTMTHGRGYEAMMEVCDSNDSKLGAGKNDNGKVNKGKSFKRPELERFLLNK